MSEEWRDIKGYEGYYQVSDFGNVRSVDRYRKVTKDGKMVLINFRLIFISHVVKWC